MKVCPHCHDSTIQVRRWGELIIELTEADVVDEDRTITGHRGHSGHRARPSIDRKRLTVEGLLDSWFKAIEKKVPSEEFPVGQDKSSNSATLPSLHDHTCPTTERPEFCEKDTAISDNSNDTKIFREFHQNQPSISSNPLPVCHLCGEEYNPVTKHRCSSEIQCPICYKMIALVDMEHHVCQRDNDQPEQKIDRCPEIEARETNKDGYFATVDPEEIIGLHKELARLQNLLYQNYLYTRRIK